MLDVQLYSSGIYCENTPEHDDLFGFSVKHVQDEARRGYKLVGSHIITYNFVTFSWWKSGGWYSVEACLFDPR